MEKKHIYCYAMTNNGKKSCRMQWRSYFKTLNKLCTYKKTLHLTYSLAPNMYTILTFKKRLNMA